MTKLRASDGFVLGTFPAGSPDGIAFDGSTLWMADGAGGTVTKMRASDGAVLGTFPVGEFPNGIAFYGSNLWVSNTLSALVT